MKRGILILLGLGGLVGTASAQDAATGQVVPIQVMGDPAKRFSLVVLSEGYTRDELPKFRAHLEKHLNILWSLEPFRSYRNYINVYAVEIASVESGVTCDPAHRQRRNTALRLQFQGGCDNPNARGLVFDRAGNETARQYARLATPAYDQILAIANTDTYGGIGGREATTTGGNAISPYITPHEIGHSLGRLQDEYTYRERGVKGAVYTGEEPASHHHTLLTEEAMRAQQKKWFRWLGEPSEAGGVIGRFEGGLYHVAGVWRPSKHSLMISLGYYFDQVSRERLLERISNQVELIPAATPTDQPVAAHQTLWIETAHPVFHDLEVSWLLDGSPVRSAQNARELDLRRLNLRGNHTVSVKVVDPTAFVRDPLIRDTSFSATRTWRVRSTSGSTSSGPAIITGSTQTTRPVSGQEIVYVETSHPKAGVVPVAWRLNGRPISTPTRTTFDLAAQRLPAGTHQLTASIGNQTRAWVVDHSPPAVTFTLSAPDSVRTRADGAPHYFFQDQFTMKLEPRDDQPGYAIAEFRVNGDGWHHYYGWPDAAPGTPFLFTARGTNIKELIYGCLCAEGLSPQPWETRAPGWGTHRIEYRARDAAGNIGAAREFYVTVSEKR